MDPPVSAGWKHARDIGVTLVTGFVADVTGTRNLRRGKDSASHGATRGEEEAGQTE